MAGPVCLQDNYSQGNEAGKIMFSLVCENTPEGTVVSLTSDVNGPQPQIVIPPTVVVNNNSFIVGADYEIPPGYQTTLTYCYTLPSGVPAPPGMSIGVYAFVTVRSGKRISMSGNRIGNNPKN